jgi:DNA-binding response OmpR family regulator
MEVTPATILLVEDHLITRRFVADNLTADGYELLEATSLAEARRAVTDSYPDLAIVDLGLPDGDGLDLVRIVRTSDRTVSRIDPDLPLLILTGRGGELDRLRGFERGADDYLQKPFSYQELRARIGALLRRTARRPGVGRLRAGALELDPVARRVWLRGRPVELSKKEYDLLRALISDPGRVFTRAELLRAVWGFDHVGRTRTLDSHAYRLRQKLSTEHDRFVINVWGVGFRLYDGSAP